MIVFSRHDCILLSSAVALVLSAGSHTIEVIISIIKHREEIQKDKETAEMRLDSNLLP